MDFGFLPPEINSGRMYDGPGPGPMLAAAAAWGALAGELHSAATSYESVISELTAGPWLGASSAEMTSAVAPYVAWMRTSAIQAEQTAIQAKAAAAAYEVTFAAMVPPPVIAANRILLQALIATNLFGQNTPAIAFTETLYAEMWAQDATAMYGYAGASASATSLTPFTPAPQTTTGTSAAASAQAAATAAQGLAATALPADVPGVETNILFIPGLTQAGLIPLNTIGEFVDLQFDDDELRDEALRSNDERILNTFTFNGWRLAPPDVAVQPPPAPTAVPSVSAGLGQASTVGRLSVPTSWTTAAPEIRLAALASPVASVSAAPEVVAASPGSLFSEMTLANMAGRALGGTPTPGRQGRITSAAGPRPKQSDSSPTGHMNAMAADVHEFADALLKLGDLRDSGLLTEEEFSKEKDRLLAR